MNRNLLLSLIIPAYNFGDGLHDNIVELDEYLSAIADRFEIILVDDGSKDGSVSKCSGIPNVSILRFERNRGKGAAIRAGVAQSKGQYVVFTDADLPYEMDDMKVVLSNLKEGFQLAIGDRTLAGSTYYPSTYFRRFFSRLFSRIVAIYISGDFGDTQCGLKGFQGDTARRLFRLCRIDRFAIDVEVLFIAISNGLSIKRVPVHLKHHSKSSVNILTDPFLMIRDIFMIRYNHKKGLYAWKD